MTKKGKILLYSGLVLGLMVSLALAFDLDLIPSEYNPINRLLAYDDRPLREITILDANDQVLEVLQTREDEAENIVMKAGIQYQSGDVISSNGQTLESGQTLSTAGDTFLKYQPGIPIKVMENGIPHTFSSARPTLGQALWDNGIVLSSRDRLSLPLNTPLSEPITVTLRRASPINIQTSDKTLQTSSAAETVGQTLQEAGFSLQGSDYAIPAEDQPLPANRSIQVVRMTDQVVLEQKSIPFENETVYSDTVPLDQSQIIQAGQTGLQVSRVRVRYQDGQEIGRSVESDWTVSQPVNQKVGIGTLATVQTLDTPSGTIEYYRSMTVYATSYSPCNSDADRCYPSTANGMKVQRGVIGVTRAWYNLLAGQRVYVPGYGIAVIADIGGGISGKQWIDLGFSDSDYEEWSQNVTIYFLTPIPSNVPWNLP